MVKSSMTIAAECIKGSIVSDLEGMRDAWKKTAGSLGSAYMIARAKMIAARNLETANKEKETEAAIKILNIFFSLVARKPVQISIVKKGKSALSIASDLDKAFGRSSNQKAWDSLRPGAPMATGLASPETNALIEIAKAGDFQQAFEKKVMDCFDPLIRDLKFKAESMAKRETSSTWKKIDRRHPNEQRRIMEVESMILDWYLEQRSDYFMWSHMPAVYNSAERAVLVERMLWTEFIFGSVPTLHWKTKQRPPFGNMKSNATSGKWKPYTKHPPKMRVVSDKPFVVEENIFFKEEKSQMTHVSKEVVRSMARVGIPTTLLGIDGAVDTPSESKSLHRWAANNTFTMERNMIPVARRSGDIMYSEVHTVPN